MGNGNISLKVVLRDALDANGLVVFNEPLQLSNLKHRIKVSYRHFRYLVEPRILRLKEEQRQYKIRRSKETFEFH